MTGRDESDDLNLHVKLCSERYQGIREDFNRLEERMDKIDKKVDMIQSEIINSQKSLKTVIISTTATVISGLIALVVTILMRF